MTSAAIASIATIQQPQEVCVDVLLEKYAKGAETSAQEIFARVAKAIAGNEKVALRKKWEAKFLENMNAGAVGAGRIMSSAGSGIQATLINCFVQPVGDAIRGVDDDGLPGIYVALEEAAETMRRGGGVGYDFSPIRPLDAYVKGTHSMASGPCSYMDVFDASCKTVESAGGRRGAQMGVLRIDHPDVLQFITAKRTPGRWNNFNVSVGVPDSFLEAVEANGMAQLVHKARPSEKLIAAGAKQRADGMWVYKEVSAVEIWDLIMQSAYDFAEPGILFLDRMNKDNNLSYCETIRATNPCGEQPLPEYGCCDLGPLILTKFVRNPFGIEGAVSFDFAGFEAAVATQVRFLDNVLDVTHWPLAQQKAQSDSKRRIGVGFTGLGDALTMLKLRYNSAEGLAMAVRIAEVMRDSAYIASVELAKEKGSFPMFDAKQYLSNGTFASRLPAKIKALISKHGIRNSHLLSIAPVGTISLAFADNASNGIEPAFSWFYTRNKREADGSKRAYIVEDHAYRVYRSLGGDVNNLPDYFVSAMEMPASDHIEMMRVVQPFIDTAISKTVNVAVDMPFDEFKSMYMLAHKAGLKGLATYRPNATLGAVLEVTPTAKVEEVAAAPVPALVAPTVDPMRAVIERRPAGDMPAVSEKVVYWTSEGKKSLYLIVSFMPVVCADGVTRERAIEVFMPVSQTGESQQWISSTMRMLSLTARAGMLDKALADMRKVAWDRGPVRLGQVVRHDGHKAPMFHDSEAAALAYAIQEIISRRAAAQATSGVQLELADEVEIEEVPSTNSEPVMAGKKCHECGAHAVVKRDGCEKCTSCGAVGSCG